MPERPNPFDFTRKCGIMEVYNVRFDEPITMKSGDILKITYTLERDMSNRPNEQNRQHLRNLMDLLSDEHTEVAHAATKASGALLKIDEMDPTIATTTTRDALTRRAQWALAALEELLDAQALRVSRMRDEVEEMKKNIKIA
jgi:hypothetical protein